MVTCSPVSAGSGAIRGRSRYAHAVRDVWEARLDVRAPVEYHCLCVGGDEQRTIGERQDDREMVCVERVQHELFADKYRLGTHESQADALGSGSADRYSR